MCRNYSSRILQKADGNNRCDFREKQEGRAGEIDQRICALFTITNHRSPLTKIIISLLIVFSSQAVSLQRNSFGGGGYNDDDSDGDSDSDGEERSNYRSNSSNGGSRGRGGARRASFEVSNVF